MVRRQEGRGPGPGFVAWAGTLALVVAVLLFGHGSWLSTSGPTQATPTVGAEPTEVPPTPVPMPGTPEPTGRCRSGVPSPRFAWTLYVAPRVGSATGMWVPLGENGGPYLKAHIKALYGDVWYGATLHAATGRIIPDPSPPWPRPDLIRSAAAGVQTTRSGNPMCGRAAEAALPPCYAELVVPLVFLDRLVADGPYLRNAYFWIPSNQVRTEDGKPSRMTALDYSITDCDTRRAGPRMATARPVYAQFSGCSAASKRIDTCFLVGCGDLWLHCQ